MVDIVSLVALVIAVVALFIAAIQVTQQLLSTGYTIRKCDSIIAGEVVKGGVRKFHWRQFRFTVQYEAIVFALKQSVYAALKVVPAVQLGAQRRVDLWNRARATKEGRTTAQGCWISFVQDMVPVILQDHIGAQLESGDQVPDDLTVAPVQVDVITVVLMGVASGMQVSRYSPETADVRMSGRTGSVSSSNHPILGTLLHYSPSNLAIPDNQTQLIVQHGIALNQNQGVWANAVFGRFNDRHQGRGYWPLAQLMAAKMPILKAGGWPEGSTADSIGGAACFLSFADADSYRIVPPSCVFQWAPHLGEVIVKAHLQELRDKNTPGINLPEEFVRQRSMVIEQNGCSSPCIGWEGITGGPEEYSSAFWRADSLNWSSSLQPINLATPTLVNSSREDRSTEEDPSTYVRAADALEVIIRADHARRAIVVAMRDLYPRFPLGPPSQLITAKSVGRLAEIGPPSWGRARKEIGEWGDHVDKVSSEVTRALEPQIPGIGIQLAAYARLSMLRAAYYTIMMRSAGSTGRGINADQEPVTSLAYMA